MLVPVPVHTYVWTWLNFFFLGGVGRVNTEREMLHTQRVWRFKVFICVDKLSSISDYPNLFSQIPNKIHVRSNTLQVGPCNHGNGDVSVKTHCIDRCELLYTAGGKERELDLGNVHICHFFFQISTKKNVWLLKFNTLLEQAPVHPQSICRPLDSSFLHTSLLGSIYYCFPPTKWG